MIRRSAFTKAISSGRNIVAILDHEKKVQNVLGSTAGGSLMLTEDETGLYFAIRSADTQAARDAAAIIRGNPIGVSFAFVAGKQRRTTQPDGSILREIIDVSFLEEISLVVDAAYKSSDVQVIAMADARSRPTPLPIGSWEDRQQPTIGYLQRQLDQTELEFQCASKR